MPQPVTVNKVNQLCICVQSCPTLCNPMVCSVPGSSVHGIFQAKILKWVSSPFPGNFPNPGIEPRSLKLQVDSLAAEPNPDTILKSRDTTLLTKVRIVKALVYPVVMYGCESWTIKKSGCQRIDALGLWCWRRLLRVP